MTNAEFYKDEIKNFESGVFCDKFIKPVILKRNDCAGMVCEHCHTLTTLWLMEEHKNPKVDWENVPIDTPILVSDNDNAYWEKRHFAEFVNGKIYAWGMGATSFSNINGKVR